MRVLPEDRRTVAAVAGDRNHASLTRLRIAVVVPTLDEAANLANCLRDLESQSRRADRIVVADGGSRDATFDVANDFAVDTLRCQARGRGLQIREALESIDADIVLVVHADMRLASESLAAIENWMQAHLDCPGGCLGHRIDGRGLLYRAIEWFDWLRARFRGVSYGDQGQFFRLDRLAEIGGFPKQPIMEDLEISQRFSRRGRMAYLGIPVTVSARRFEKLGVWRTIWANLRYRREYRKGGLAACDAIYRQYHERVDEIPTA